MRRAVQLNVFFIVFSCIIHLIVSESTLGSVAKNEEEDSTFKSHRDLDDDYRVAQKLGNLSEPNYSENDPYDNTTSFLSGSGDNQTWTVPYDMEKELANDTQDDYRLSNRNEDPKSDTTARTRWEEPEPSTTEGAQPEFSATVRNRGEKTEFNTTEEAQPRFSTTERGRLEEPESSTAEGAQTKFVTGGSDRWEDTKLGITEKSQWTDPEYGTTERKLLGEPKTSTTEGLQPKFSATGRNRWEEPQSNTTEQSRWEKTEFNTTEETQTKFGTTGKSGWEEPESSTAEGAQTKFVTAGSNQSEFSNHTESATEELWTPSTETNNTSYVPVEQEPTATRQPLLYRNYGYVNDTNDVWHVTLYDENKAPCLRMNLQIVINVFFARYDPRSSVRAAALIVTFPTSPDDLTVEGECNNGTSLVFVSWETSNLTWHFDQGENGDWSLREVELTVTNPDWFDKYDYCRKPSSVDETSDWPCHPFSFKSGNGSWYNSGTRCRQVNVPLSEKGGTPLKAVVFLMRSFRAEPFSLNGTDFEATNC